MNAPWQCPSCSRILAPHIDVCPCSDPGAAGVPAVPLTPLEPDSATAGLTISGCTAGTRWEGVTIHTVNETGSVFDTRPVTLLPGDAFAPNLVRLAS